MRDPLQVLSSFQEAVPAFTGVFGKTSSLGHGMNSMTEQIAEIAHALAEKCFVGERIVLQGKKERVSTLHTDVFTMTAPLSGPDVAVPSDEARDRVTDSGFFSSILKIGAATRTDSGATGGASKSRVVHRMAKEETAEPYQEPRQRCGGLRFKGFDPRGNEIKPSQVALLEYSCWSAPSTPNGN